MVQALSSSSFPAPEQSPAPPPAQVTKGAQWLAAGSDLKGHGSRAENTGLSRSPERSCGSRRAPLAEDRVACPMAACELEAHGRGAQPLGYSPVRGAWSRREDCEPEDCGRGAQFLSLSRSVPPARSPAPRISDGAPWSAEGCELEGRRTFATSSLSLIPPSSLGHGGRGEEASVPMARELEGHGRGTHPFRSSSPQGSTQLSMQTPLRPRGHTTEAEPVVVLRVPRHGCAAEPRNMLGADDAVSVAGSAPTLGSPRPCAAELVAPAAQAGASPVALEGLVLPLSPWAQSIRCIRSARELRDRELQEWSARLRPAPPRRAL